MVEGVFYKALGGAGFVSTEDLYEFAVVPVLGGG